MISCVVVFDGHVTGVVYDDTHQELLASCVKFSHTVVVVIGVAAPLTWRTSGQTLFSGQAQVDQNSWM